MLLEALATAVPERIPAASNGSMNNLALGGYDPFRRVATVRRGATYCFIRGMPECCQAR